MKLRKWARHNCVTAIFVLFFLSFLLLALLLAPIQPVKAETFSVPTLYFTTNTTWYGENLGGGVARLQTTQLADDEQSEISWVLPSLHVHWSIAVSIMGLNGTSHSLGANVADVERTANGEGYQSATWDCPDHTMWRNDTVSVIVYTKVEGGSWTQMVSGIHSLDEWFIVPYGVTSLVASTWNVTYYTYRLYTNPMSLKSRFYFGHLTYNSNITNVKFDDGISLHSPIGRFSYTPSNPTTYQTVTFNATNSTDVDGTIASYSWDFGDGNTSAGVTATHSYSTQGDYDVALNVIDDDGYSDVFQQTVSVSPPTGGSAGPGTPSNQTGSWLNFPTLNQFLSGIRDSANSVAQTLSSQWSAFKDSVFFKWLVFAVLLGGLALLVGRSHSKKKPQEPSWMRT